MTLSILCFLFVNIIDPKPLGPKAIMLCQFEGKGFYAKSYKPRESGVLYEFDVVCKNEFRDCWVKE